MKYSAKSCQYNIDAKCYLVAIVINCLWYIKHVFAYEPMLELEHKLFTRKRELAYAIAKVTGL